MPTPSSKPSLIPSKSRRATGSLALLALFLLSAETLPPVAVSDSKIVKKWTISGDPHGVAVGADGTLYVGLATPQAIIAIDPKTGAVKQRVVLDSVDIASTKELVTLRTNRERTRLYVANGSDESASILSLPNLAVVREVTMEGEPIRDAVPDPKNRYVYLLGRKVHVFDAKAEREVRTLPLDDPTAIAATASAVYVAAGDEVVSFDAATFAETSRTRLGAKPVTALVPMANGEVAAFTNDALIANGRSNPVCLPAGSGPQIAANAGELLLFAERKCAGSAPPAGAASLYGVSAYAVAYDPVSRTLAATDRAGSLTIYRVPRAAVVH